MVCPLFLHFFAKKWYPQSLASPSENTENSDSKAKTLAVKLPTPVANNHAAATALAAAGNNNIDLFEDEEEASLDGDYVSTLKLNVLIGLVVLLGGLHKPCG